MPALVSIYRIILGAAPWWLWLGLILMLGTAVWAAVQWWLLRPAGAREPGQRSLLAAAVVSTVLVAAGLLHNAPAPLLLEPYREPIVEVQQTEKRVGLLRWLRGKYHRYKHAKELLHGR